MGARINELPGLQAERTLLSWDRTALGLLGNGALLMLRDVQPLGAARLVPAAAALLLAVLCALAGRRRTKRIGRPTATVAAPTLEVVVLGATVTVLGLAVIGVLVV
jgi:putative membrane protein